jgi:hypothetical protein
MRTSDFTPLWRPTVGFDRLFEMLDESVRWSVRKTTTRPTTSSESARITIGFRWRSLVSSPRRSQSRLSRTCSPWRATRRIKPIITRKRSVYCNSLFAITVTMAIVLSQRKDFPYPWLWTLFLIFIVACGLTHVVHVWSAYTGAEYLGAQVITGLITAAASVGTAIAFAVVLP